MHNLIGQIGPAEAYCQVSENIKEEENLIVCFEVDNEQ